MHGLKSAIDRGADAWARSLPGRVLDRYVSRSGPLLANGLAYGLLFAFFCRRLDCGERVRPYHGRQH